MIDSTSGDSETEAISAVPRESSGSKAAVEAFCRATRFCRHQKSSRMLDVSGQGDENPPKNAWPRACL